MSFFLQNKLQIHNKFWINQSACFQNAINDIIVFAKMWYTVCPFSVNLYCHIIHNTLLCVVVSCVMWNFITKCINLYRYYHILIKNLQKVFQTLQQFFWLGILDIYFIYKALFIYILRMKQKSAFS